MEYKDYYQILEVSKSADEQVIKSAYRKLARQYHPDVNDNKAFATEKFKELNEAYTVLSDPEKRRHYDSFDARWTQRSYSSSQSYGRASTSRQSYQRTTAQQTDSSTRSRQSRRRTYTQTIDADDLENILRGFAAAYGSTRTKRKSSGGDFSDFFDALFGSFWASEEGSGQRTPQPRGKDIRMSTEVSLKEAFTGTTRTLRYSDGRRVEVTIPAGSSTGTRLRLQGQGQRSLFGARGDLFLDMEVTPDPRFERKGDDLWVKVNVDQATVDSSGELQVPTMEQPVWLTLPADTQHGQAIRLRGKGMPSLQTPGQMGDLFAVVQITKGRRRRAKKQAGDSTGGSWRNWLRRLTGIGLLAVGLIAIAAQAVAGTPVGWLLVMALALILVEQGLSSHSRGWIMAGVASLVAASFLATQANLQINDVLTQGWPLIPAASGYYLLRRGEA
ncbi:MAG: DnaJ C-terminal domain-containing protein [Chloroflexota bacterium]|nr:DnaJ C-terminal domain-containing protein [Chloroflexota bacterium]